MYTYENALLVNSKNYDEFNLLLMLQATHTGLKEHKCKFCKREFTHKSSMYCHQKRVHPEAWAKIKISDSDMAD